MFRKKQRLYPSESKWSILNGERNGNPMFIRKNESAEALAAHPDYSYRVGIAIPLLEPNAQGLPNNTEMEALNRIEDKLVGTLESNQDSLLVLSITTSGMREFVFYTRDPQGSKNLIEEAKREIQDHQLQFYIAEDKKWEIYHQFS